MIAAVPAETVIVPAMTCETIELTDASIVASVEALWIGPAAADSATAVGTVAPKYWSIDVAWFKRSARPKAPPVGAVMPERLFVIPVRLDSCAVSPDPPVIAATRDAAGAPIADVIAAAPLVVAAPSAVFAAAVGFVRIDAAPLDRTPARAELIEFAIGPIAGGGFGAIALRFAIVMLPGWISPDGTQFKSSFVATLISLSGRCDVEDWPTVTTCFTVDVLVRPFVGWTSLTCWPLSDLV